MKVNVIKSFIKDNGLVIGIIVIVVVLLRSLLTSKGMFSNLFGFYKKVGSKVSDGLGGIFYGETKIKSDQEVNDYLKSHSLEGVNFSTSQLQQMSDAIYTAMKGLGTKEDAIFQELLKLETKDDWEALEYTFSKRGGNTLYTALESELDSFNPFIESADWKRAKSIINNLK